MKCEIIFMQNKGNPMKKITVGVITYKRPQGLKKLLDSICEQAIDNIEVDVLIVDNDTAGENNETIESLRKTAPYNLLLFVEKEKGIVKARNRVVSEFLKTDSEALIFVDDDEWPVKTDWIQTLIETQKNKDADIIYSNVEIIPETDQLSWTKDAFTGNSMGSDIVITDKFYTNNILIRRNVLEEMHPLFDMRFAMTGSSDLHFCMKANKEGYIAYFTPHAPVQEIFHSSRATLKWFFLRGYRIGEGSTRVYLYEESFPKKYLHIFTLFFGRFARIIQNLLMATVLLKKSYLARATMYTGTTLGTIAGLFGLKYNEYEKTHGK